MNTKPCLVKPSRQLLDAYLDFCGCRRMIETIPGCIMEPDEVVLDGTLRKICRYKYKTGRRKGS